MPTVKQMHRSWRLQYSLGLSEDQYRCNDFSNFVSSEKDELEEYQTPKEFDKKVLDNDLERKFEEN